MLAVMGLLPWTAKVTADRLAFDGRDLLALSDRQRRQIIGKDMAMLFQEPTTSLNPCFTVGFQITESLQTHLGGSRAEHRRRAVELLALVGIPAADPRPSAFPHQPSGGLYQPLIITTPLASNHRPPTA